VKSWDLEERCLAVFSERGTSHPAEVVERSDRVGAWGLTLAVGRGGSGDNHEGQYQCLESNASDYREPVEVAEEGG